MSMWRFGKLLLDKYCLASERVATSMISMLSGMQTGYQVGLRILGWHNFEYNRSFKTSSLCQRNRQFLMGCDIVALLKMVERAFSTV